MSHLPVGEGVLLILYKNEGKAEARVLAKDVYKVS